MFDARAAKALKAGDHLTIDDAPGLRLVASETVRAWIYRYRSPVDGRMRQVRLGRWPAMGFPQALAAWQGVKDARDAGADPAAAKRERRAQERLQVGVQAYTVRKGCDDYLAGYARQVAPKTYAEAERMLAAGGDVAPIEGRAMASITRADAFELIDGRSAYPVQAGRLRQLLGAVWDRALDAGKLAPDVPNWWRLILRGKLASRGKVVGHKIVDGKIVGGQHQGEERRALTEVELAQLLPWLPNFTRDIEDALTLYLWTCCRGGEIVQMERSELADEADGLWWTVPKAKLKMRRVPALGDVRVPLMGRAEAVVRRRLAAARGEFLFHSRAACGHIQQKAVGVAVWMHMPRCETRPEWVRPRLPVVDWAPHDLRRTGRTLLAALGCPDEVGEAILGHLQPGVRGVYNVHRYDAERRLWLTRLADRLEQLGAGQGRAAGR